MNLADSTITRFFSVIIALIGPALQYWSSLKARLYRARMNELAVKKLGRPFAAVIKWPNRVAVTVLVIVIVLSVIALLGGILTTSSDPQTLQRQRDSAWLSIPLKLFEWSLWICLSYVVLAVFVQLNLLPRLMLLLTARSSYRPGWINALRYLREDETLGPVNTDTTACEAVANSIFNAMSKGEFEYDEDRAFKPTDLSTDELANYLLIANGIESKIHDLSQGGAGINFRTLYDTLASVAKNKARPFHPDSILAASPLGFYSWLRTLATNSTYLPDEPTISLDVGKLVATIAAKHKASARSLATTWFSRKPSLARAMKRLNRLPLLSGSEHEAMRVQFLKLAVNMNVWTGVNPGPFVYPFSRGIAVLLLNLRCLIARPADKSLVIDDGFRRLVAWTESVIVARLEELIHSLNDEPTKQLCQRAFDCEPSQVRSWQLAYEIDYFLWSQSRKPGRGWFGEDATKPWGIEGTTLVRS